MLSTVNEALVIQENIGELCAPPIIGIHRSVFCRPINRASETHDRLLHTLDVLLYKLHAKLTKLIRRNICLLDLVRFLDYYFDW